MCLTASIYMHACDVMPYKSIRLVKGKHSIYLGRLRTDKDREALRKHTDKRIVLEEPTNYKACSAKERDESPPCVWREHGRNRESGFASDTKTKQKQRGYGAPAGRGGARRMT